MYSFFNEGVAFVLLILLANYIAPAEYGQLSLFNTIVSFLGYFVALSSQGFVSISYFRRGDEHFKKDFSCICAICLAVTGIFCLINIVGGEWLARQADLTVILLWIAIAISFFKIFQETWLNWYRIKEDIGKYGLISCGFAILNLVFSLYLVIETPLNWQGRIYAQLGCTLLFGVIAIIYFGRKHFYTRHITWPNVKLVALYGIPLIPHLASLWIKQGGDRFIINHYHTIEDVGLFSFALNLTSVIIMIGSAFNNTNSVSIYKILSDNNTVERKLQLLGRQTRNIAIILLGASVAVVAGMSLLVPLLLPRYNGAMPYFLILSLQGVGQCFYFLFCNYLFYYMKTKQLMYITFSTSLLHLVLSLWLTRYSLYITCVIYVVTQAIITILIYYFSRRLLRQNLIKIQEVDTIKTE